MPLVAVVGRPNVGKSTLVNRIVGRKEAIVEETPGVTRDRKYLAADWAGRKFILIDTGGLDFVGEADLIKKVRQQAVFAIGEADVIVFLVDGVTGPLPSDEEVADVLRRSQKPTILLVNKLDDPDRILERAAFYKLGLGEPLEISALHGIGVGDFLDELVKLFPEKKELKEEEKALTIAIIGRPNVGKSSILNRILGEERAIVSEVPGTTRDTIDSLLSRNDKKYLFVDTAGLRKNAKVETAIEYYSSLRVLRAIDRAELVLLVIDAVEGVTDQDQKIASQLREKGRATIVLLNKWDLVDRERGKEVFRNSQEKLHFIGYAPLLRVSALTGQGFGKLFPSIDSVAANYRMRVSTSALNDFIDRAKVKLQLSVGGKILKILYGTQVKMAPPAFVFFVNLPGAGRLISPGYLRYLEKRLREVFDFTGVPIRIRFRQSK
jgi:GTP-binding protein